METNTNVHKKGIIRYKKTQLQPVVDQILVSSKVKGEERGQNARNGRCTSPLKKHQKCCFFQQRLTNVQNGMTKLY